MSSYKEKKETAVKYKWISIVFLCLDFFITYQKPWFTVSEKLLAYLNIGDSFLSSFDVQKYMSESLQKIYNCLINGKFTLWEFQRTLSFLADYASDEEYEKTAFYLVQAFQYIIIAFLCVMVLEIILHILDINFSGWLILCDLLLIPAVFFFFGMVCASLEEEIGEGGIGLTPYFFIAVILPFIATVLWGKYLGMKKELQKLSYAGVSYESMGTPAAEAVNAQETKKEGKYCPQCGRFMEKCGKYCGYCGQLLEIKDENTK